MELANRLSVDRSEFNHAIRTFRGRRGQGSLASLAFDSGILSIEADDLMTTCRAGGEWQGCALFSAQVLAALAKVPPAENPVIIEYSQGKLSIGPLSITCDWSNVSDDFIGQLESPSVLDLIAIGRSMPAAEIHRTGLWRRISRAKATVTSAVSKAMKHLQQLEISEAELHDLVEARIRSRLKERSPS